jgi:poly [ADP-ribose] polymerase
MCVFCSDSGNSRVLFPLQPEKGFVVEYAKSSRSGCKGCKQKIDKDVLRLGKMIPSPHFDGWTPNWHHVGCFFKKKIKIHEGISDIAGFTVCA